MSAAPGKVTIHGETVSRNGKPVPHTHKNYNKSYKERHADVESDARVNNLVTKLDVELRKDKPDFGVVLRYYFDHFEQLTKSSFVKGAHFFNAFSRTLHKYFFPPNVMLWHWDGEKCVPVGPNPNPRPWVNCTTFPYKRGCKNNELVEIQKCLGISSDGKFGKDTERALKDKGYDTIITKELYDKIMSNCGNTTTTTTRKFVPDETEIGFDEINN